jgi:hypothetical protein
MTADKLVTAADRFAREVQDREQRFIPHAAKWLNEDRFLELIEPPGSEAPRARNAAPSYTPEESEPPSKEQLAKVKALVSKIGVGMASGSSARSRPDDTEVPPRRGDS